MENNRPQYFLQPECISAESLSRIIGKRNRRKIYGFVDRQLSLIEKSIREDIASDVDYVSMKRSINNVQSEEMAKGVVDRLQRLGFEKVEIRFVSVDGNPSFFVDFEIPEIQFYLDHQRSSIS